MFFRRLNWNVVGWFNIVSWISYAIIALGVTAMVYHYATTGSALRLGLSFTGGTDITVTYKQSVTRDQIAGALQKVGVSDAQINTLTKPGDVGTPRWTIETQKDFGNDSTSLKSALGTVAPIDPSQVSVSTVGPSLSHEYLFNAVKALVIAISIQFLYIAFRFGWNYIFGLVTVIALVRDSAMMIGIYALADKRVDDAFLAAVLTVIGYSVMDTIVILDRIRENVKLMAGQKFDTIVNTSILQTMTRSVNTLATVVVTLVALLALGGASLQNFAFALLVGICSGGYHSIFYSAPLVAKLQNAQRARATAAGTQLEPPRTKAEARAQAARAAGAPVADRDAVLAARKARQDRERAARQQRNGAPARYKKRRPSAPASAVGVVEPELEHEYEDGELEHDDDVLHDGGPAHGAFEHDVDPLDAQNAGQHDLDYELGHEEIHLNLDAVEAPHYVPPPAPPLSQVVPPTAPPAQLPPTFPPPHVDVEPPGDAPK
jgi:preprotein translocase SecF subunit